MEGELNSEPAVSRRVNLHVCVTITFVHRIHEKHLQSLKGV
jgi:hypothetical protein